MLLNSKLDARVLSQPRVNTAPRIGVPVVHAHSSSRVPGIHAGPQQRTTRRNVRVLAQAPPTESKPQQAESSGKPGFDINERVEFLKEDLKHLFDDKGIDPRAYDDVVEFRDPITQYNSLSGYLFNIQMLKRVFDPVIELHDIRAIGPYAGFCMLGFARQLVNISNGGRRLAQLAAQFQSSSLSAAAPQEKHASMSTANVQVVGEKLPAPCKVNNSPEANYVKLANGVLMPMIGYGTFQLQDADMVKQALETGYRHLDCASLYGNQELVGQGIKKWIEADPSKNKREDLFVTSKIFNDEHRPELLRKSAEKSIAELGTKYLDLLLLHWPDAFKPGSGSSFHGEVCPKEGPKPPGCVVFDDEVTMEQTWRAMEKLVEDGLVRCIGLSNFSWKQVLEVINMAKIKPTINEIELHPFLAQHKFVKFCAHHGVQCLAYGPLGGPNAYLPNDLLPHPTVTQVAQEAGKSNGQVLVKWSVQRGIPVLVKTGTASRLKENLIGMHDYNLTEGQMKALDSLENGKRFVTVPWKKWEEEPVPDVPEK